MHSEIFDILYGEESLYPKNLERHHPYILEKIVRNWHTPQMEGIFLELMVTTREDRQGFSHEVVSELYYLSQVFEGTRNFPKTIDDNPLVQIGATPDKTANLEHSSQNFAAMRGHSDDSPWAHISPEARYGIESLGYPCTPAGLLKATAAKDLKAIGLFLHCDINVDSCDMRGWSPLMLAAFNGNLPLAKIFIEFSANLSLKDKGGFTPLHWAAFNGHEDVVKHFVTHNADINARSLSDFTPLMMAAMNGHLSACSALMASGAETGFVSSAGWTALQMASFNQHVPVIKLFLSMLKVHVPWLKPKADDDGQFDKVSIGQPIPYNDVL
jgi:uncharacterized protein